MKTMLYAESYGGKVFPHKEKTICSFIYLHRKVERLNGYDIVEVPRSDEFFRKDRIEDVIVVLHSGKKINARLFLWHSAPYDEQSRRYMEENPVYNVHGLVVAKGDTRGMIDAAKKFHEKRSFI